MILLYIIISLMVSLHIVNVDYINNQIVSDSKTDLLITIITWFFTWPIILIITDIIPFIRNFHDYYKK